jgi:hypothetical protein
MMRGRHKRHRDPSGAARPGPCFPFQGPETFGKNFLTKPLCAAGGTVSYFAVAR